MIDKTARKFNVGFVSSLTRYGGGTYQWSLNMLHALDDYRQERGDVCVHVFYAPGCEGGEYIRAHFPRFSYRQVTEGDILLIKFLTRFFILMPWTLAVLRLFYPLSRIAKESKIDLMIFPGASFHSSFYSGRQLFLFTDIMHVFFPHFPEVSANGELRRRHLMFGHGIKQASRIVVDSQALMRDVVRYYQADIAKVDVLYQTILTNDEEQKDLKEQQADFARTLPARYIFYPAQLWPHKNHKNLLLAMKLVLAHEPDLFLVLSGSKKEGCEKIFSLIDELGIKERVLYLGYVADQFMPVLYKKAQMLVMPTYFWPTHIPVLEAFCFGCPVLVSNMPAVEEQSGDAALFFDPDSPEDIAVQVRRVLNDVSLRAEMVRKGYERAKLFSFSNYRKTFFSILDKSWNEVKGGVI